MFILFVLNILIMHNNLVIDVHVKYQIAFIGKIIYSFCEYDVSC